MEENEEGKIRLVLVKVTEEEKGMRNERRERERESEIRSFY